MISKVWTNEAVFILLASYGVERFDYLSKNVPANERENALKREITDQLKRIQWKDRLRHRISEKVPFVTS